MKLFTVATVLFSMLLVTGCGRNVFFSDADYDRAWVASQTVMHRHGLKVKPSKTREDTLIAVSRVQGDFGTSKNRVKVVTRIVQDEDGYFAPSVRVLEQLDVSEPKAWGHSNYQPNHHWVNVGNNAAMEARLYNEIMDVMAGQVNTYSGQAWQPVTHQEEAPQRSATPTQAGIEKEQETEEADALDFSPETF